MDIDGDLGHNVCITVTVLALSQGSRTLFLSHGFSLNFLRWDLIIYLFIEHV